MSLGTHIKKFKWENFIEEITISKGHRHIPRYQPQYVCINIWKWCLCDYNVLDCSNCLVEVKNTKEDKTSNIKSKEIVTQKIIEVLYSFCFFFCEATKLKYGGIPSIFDKTLELIRKLCPNYNGSSLLQEGFLIKFTHKS